MMINSDHFSNQLKSEIDLEEIKVTASKNILMNEKQSWNRTLNSICNSFRKCKSDLIQPLGSLTLSTKSNLEFSQALKNQMKLVSKQEIQMMNFEVSKIPIKK